ncbi:MAG: SMP-30/gluconolactonase/LRE family protein [Acidimicrobiales bacterium]
MTELVEIASGLRFPEGPVAMPDGSVLVVEIARGTLSRVRAGGAVEVVADCGGGPNGAAIGPDGAVYVCNNGGFFDWSEVEGIGLVPSPGTTHQGGSIQRVDAATGAVEILYRACGDEPLIAPNDLVFDAHGGFWFTDHGVTAGSSQAAVLYAAPDGSRIEPVVRGLESPNGIGLSPDGSRLYVAETHHGRLWTWEVTGPGRVAASPSSPGPHGGELLHDAPEGQLFDSLAVDGEGWVCVATIVNGGITCVSPDGSVVEHLPVPDAIVTNICFGGPDLRRAFITASGTGRLLSCEWPRPGLALAF